MLAAEGRLPDAVDRLRGRRLERDRPLRRLRRRRRTCGSSAWRRRARRASCAGRAGVLHGARSSLLADADGQIDGRAFDLRGARLPRRRAGARAPAGLRPRRVRDGDRRGGARTPSAASRDRGDHPRARAGSCARAGRRRSTPSSSSSACPAAATRTSTRSLARAGEDARRLPDGRARRRPSWPRPPSRRRRHRRDRLSVLGSARRRPRHPRRGRAGARARDAHEACLDCLAAVRERVETPLVPMTYASLLEAYGYERFAADAQAAGATSLIVADLPVGAHPELRRVQLVAPTSTDERLRWRRSDGRLAVPGQRDRHDGRT